MTLDGGFSDLNNDELIGLRFSGVDIPAGAVITSAYLRFFGGNASNNGGALNVTIRGEASDDAAAFSGSDNEISSRMQNATVASTLWAVPAWTDSWESKAEHKSADITEIIKEIVARPGFATGNAIGLTVQGDSAEGRSMYLYDYTVDYPERVRMPRLVIEYQAAKPVCSVTPSLLSGEEGYLPDYSYAGYQWSEAALPHYSSGSSDITWVDVTTYGAVADDGKDDTLNIQNAIAAHQATEGTVVLHFPAGRFNLSDVITINRSHFVLQGSGSDEQGTVFQIDIPLSDDSVTKSQDIQDLEEGWNSGNWPKESDGVRYSLYSWLGGFFYTRFDGNRYSRVTVADVTAAKRDGHSLTLSNLDREIAVGDVLRLEWANPSDNALLDYLVNNENVDYGSSIGGKDVSLVAQPVTVSAINGEQISVKEPIMHDIGQAGQGWSARLRTTHYNEHVGLENFSVDFPDNSRYQGHHKEAGYNAIHMADVKHGWIHNVAVDNADSAVIVEHSKNLTLSDITTRGREGHYNVTVAQSYGVLVKDFDLGGPALHNPSMNTAASMTVYSSGHVKTAKIDQHNGLNHFNLVENLTVGYTPNLWRHGGSSSRNPTALAYNTFWNIGIAELPFNAQAGSVDNAPGARLVGIYSNGNRLNVDYTPNPYVQALNSCLAVPSLYNYQLQRRLAD